MSQHDDFVIIGYSGHAYVIIDAMLKNEFKIKGYCEQNELNHNPFQLQYLGNESEEVLKNSYWIIGIGSNKIRKSIFQRYENDGVATNIIHPTAILAERYEIGRGNFIAANTVINPLVSIGNGVIINTSATIEHECVIGDFAHVAPGAVLAGNVEIGVGTFVGANSVIKQGVVIGSNVIVGAGSVVLKDVPDNVTVVGNPSKILKHHD